ncbi:hypothetical protein AQZ52_16635 [Novosphingobium fuchskuhlense]|uniref:Uncharacterized protein n=1 Tax=Novosphingobium fuchskuhlense TaxID=1117702 RepID=A0A124JTR0_9SPHN|nr:DUF3828 domain-containing protein [Novosphingobium fuchskuhlense]KUR70444.1 hypothetical protein AQZ52_16635 [Novosphingobium fuchskuhlense]
MILAALALAAAPAATPDAAIAAIYAPFRQADMRDAAWERPIFTPRLKALIARWRAVTPTDEVDDLSDFDWLCQCQDWDAGGLGERITARRVLAPARRLITVRLGKAPGRRETLRFLLERSGRRWLVDDMFASGFRGGLRASLIWTTAADIGLRKQT